jgi:hypothetical protein
MSSVQSVWEMLTVWLDRLDLIYQLGDIGRCHIIFGHMPGKEDHVPQKQNITGRMENCILELLIKSNLVNTLL